MAGPRIIEAGSGASIDLSEPGKVKFNGIPGPQGDPGPPVADGDKGDVTVSSSGATWSTKKASTAEAVAGTDDTKVMTPARVKDVLPWVDARTYGLSTLAPDNRGALQDAIDAVTVTGGTVEIVGPGIFDIEPDAATGKGVRLKSGVTLRLTNGATLRLADDSALGSGVHNPVVYAISATDIAVIGGTIDANSTNQTGAAGDRTSCLDFISCSNVEVRGVTFKNALATSAFSGGYGIVAWNGLNRSVRVSNCHFENIGQSDLGLFWGEDWVVTNCTSRNTGYVPINVESGSGATIRNVAVSNWAIDTCNLAAITVIQNATGTVEDVIVSDVTARSVHDDHPSSSIGGVRVRGTVRTTLRGIKINGVKSHGLYVTVDSSFPVEDLTVDDFAVTGISNAVSGAVSTGVWLSGDASNNITGASLRRVTVDTPTSYGLLATYCPDLDLDEVSVRNTADSGINVGNSNRARIHRCRSRYAGNTVAGSFYGIVVTTSNGFQIDGCHVTNGVSQGIRVGGACTQFEVINNIVYDDQGTKTQTYGININTSTLSPAYIVSHNMLQGNLTAGLLEDTVTETNVLKDRNIV